MRLRILSILAAFVLGCGHTEDVIVIDSAGHPVPDATVGLAGPNMNGPEVKTDAKGVATVMMQSFPEPTKWVSIEKDGYEGMQLDAPAKWPLRVTLAAATQPATRP